MRDKDASASTGGQERHDKLAARGSRAAQPAAASLAKPRGDRGRVWVKDGNFVRPIEVQIGISDGSQTEISGAGIEGGMEVVVGEIRPEEETRDDQSVRSQVVPDATEDAALTSQAARR